MLRRHFNALFLALSQSKLSAQTAAPRLLLNPGRIEALKAAIATTHAELWRSARRRADNYAAMPAPQYEQPGPNDEQLWQRDVANRIPLLALAFLLSEDPKYLAATTAWSMASCGYPQWGTGYFNGTDLAAGHQLLSLALVLDWVGARLSTEERATLRRTLLERGARMYAAAKGDLAVDLGFWRSSYLSNHLWVNMAGLAAAGLALRDEPATEQWFRLALDKFRCSESFRGADGASHEGIGYWTYGVEYLLKFWHMSEDLAGERPSSQWWKNTAAYRLYLGLPRNAWKEDNTVVDLADSKRADEYGPDHILYRLAALNRDPQAQWLAGELRRAGVANSSSQWLDLLWYDPSVAPQSPVALPTLHHFEDMGIVSARSGWSGDESLVVFKCGPPAGHFAASKLAFDVVGLAHVHPDANHFVIFGCGQWLLRDDGYAWKDTGQHNTLLVDGKGQMEVSSAMSLRPRVVAAIRSEAADRISGDATVTYPAAAGLKRYVRSLCFLKPDVLIVVDEIETAEARRLELRFHTESPCERKEDGSFLAQGHSASLRIEPFTMDGVEATVGEIDGRDRNGKPMPMHTLRVQATRSTWRNIVAFSWSSSGTEPVRLTSERVGEEWIFRAGERSVRLTAGSTGNTASRPTAQFVQ
jgi:hypothetical protein